MHSVLFVCTANIWPLADGRGRPAFDARASKGFDATDMRIESAGTHDYQAGKPPFEVAVATAKGPGYEIADQVARRITPDDFDDFDHILVMDQQNLANLRTICPTRCKSKVELLLEYGDVHHGKEVPDPYGGPPKGYELALDMIEDGCKGLVQVLARS